MNEKSISYMENKIKKMQKTADGLHRLINSSKTMEETEKKHIEKMKQTTLHEIQQSKKELILLKRRKDT